MKKKVLCIPIWLWLVLLGGLASIACTPQTVEVEVTRVVTETVTETVTEEVEVTRVVTETEVIIEEVTVEVEAEKQEPFYITGFVFEDVSLDNVFVEGTDAPLGNVQICAMSETHGITCATSDSDGNYRIEMPNGFYNADITVVDSGTYVLPYPITAPAGFFEDVNIPLVAEDPLILDPRADYHYEERLNSIHLENYLCPDVIPENWIPENSNVRIAFLEDEVLDLTLVNNDFVADYRFTRRSSNYAELQDGHNNLINNSDVVFNAVELVTQARVVTIIKCSGDLYLYEEEK